MCEHLRVVAEDVRHAELIARPRKLVRDRAARRDELGARDLMREHRRMTLAEAAESGNADAAICLDASGLRSKKKPRGMGAGLRRRKTGGSTDQTRSMIAAMPWPPPMHIVMSA